MGPYVFGAVTHETGNIYRGLAFASIPLFLSAVLILVLSKRSVLEGAPALTRPSSETDLNIDPVR